MAVKTITIDMQAYTMLASRKRPGQSFSQVIKECLGGTHTTTELLAAVRATSFSSETLHQVERQVERRRQDSARAAAL